MALYKNVTELIGKTPLLEAENLERSRKLKARLLVKLEYFNPAGSVKDRVALNMIEDAEKSGRLKPGAVIIEPTSGNTGIGLASVAAAKGYKAVLVMPETMSVERRKLLLGYGAQLVLTEGAKGMAGAIKRAEELEKETENGIILGQFVNRANPEAHYKTTGPEIWEDTRGEVDIFVAGAGTGGTLTGVGRYLRDKKPEVKVIAVEPERLSGTFGREAGTSRTPGNRSRLCTRDPGYRDLRPDQQGKRGGSIRCRKASGSRGRDPRGVSSGAALHAAIEEAKKTENEGKTIVALLPDTGERYLSTPLFEQD